MPQVNGLGQVSATPGDTLQAQLMEAMVRQSLANQAAQVQREGIQSSERLGNRGYDTALLTQGKFSDRAASDLALERERGAKTLANTALINTGNLDVTKQTGANQAGVAQIQTAPAMGDLALRGRQYDDRAPEVRAQAALAARRAGFQGNLLDIASSAIPQAGGTIPNAQAAAAVTPTSAPPLLRPQDLRGLVFSAAGAPAPSSMMDDMIRSRLATEPGNATALMDAYNSGDYSKLPPSAGTVTPEDIAAGMEADLAEFHRRDVESPVVRGVAGAATGLALPLALKAASYIPGWPGVVAKGLNMIPGISAIGAAGGAAIGAGTATGEPTDQDIAKIRESYGKLVNLYRVRLGGDDAQARLMARAAIQRALQRVGGGTSDLTEDRTRALMESLR